MSDKRFPVFLTMTTLSILVAGMAVIPSLGFLFGRHWFAEGFWVSFGIAFCLSLSGGWRGALKFLLGAVVCGVLTAYSFAATSTDGHSCYCVVERLLNEGWNPVFEHTLDCMRNRLGNILPLPHIIYMPRVTAVVGASFASASGLWLGAPFLGYALTVILWLAAVRFMRIVFGAVGWKSWVLPFWLVAVSRMTSVLSGHVDYTVYASMVLLVLSFAIWYRSREMNDLVVMSVAFLVCATSKPTGYGYVSIALIGCGLAGVYRVLSFRRALLVGCLLFVIVGFSPLITSWVVEGSPFFPGHTFNPGNKVLDLTGDFEANGDGLRMGWFARVVYAWFSRYLAVAGCAWWYDKPDFNPVFRMGVSGRDLIFQILLYFSVVALVLSRRTIVTGICLFLFITSICLPTRYIGYSRYSPQISAVPALAFCNLIFAPRECVRRYVEKCGVVLLLILFLYALPFLLRSITFQLAQIVTERYYRDEVKQIRDHASVWSVEHDWLNRYLDCERLALEGIVTTNAASAVGHLRPSGDHYYFHPAFEGMKVHADQLRPIDNPSGIRQFPWRDLLRGIPSPVMDIDHAVLRQRMDQTKSYNP